MSQAFDPTPLQEQPGDGAMPPSGAWGGWSVPQNPAEVLEAARRLSKKGKLPGFEAGTEPGVLFTFGAFGAPIDYRVSAVASQSSPGTRIAFHARATRRVPVIFGIITLVSIWPGAPITDSLVRSYFTSYDYPSWVTWAWYFPITVLPMPFMLWRMVRNSRRSAYEHCVESIAIIRAALDG